MLSREEPSSPGCAEISARLSEYLDGEADERSRERIALHLSRCSPCARLAVELALTVQVLHGIGARMRHACDLEDAPR